MTKQARKFQAQYANLVTLNAQCAAKGLVQTGFDAVCFLSVNKQLIQCQKKVQNALNNGALTIEEYRAILQ